METLFNKYKRWEKMKQNKIIVSRFIKDLAYKKGLRFGCFNAITEYDNFAEIKKEFGIENCLVSKNKLVVINKDEVLIYQI